MAANKKTITKKTPAPVAFKPLIPFYEPAKEQFISQTNEFNPANSLISKNASFAVEYSLVAGGNYIFYTVPVGKIAKILSVVLSISGASTQADVLINSIRVLEVGSYSSGNSSTHSSFNLNYDNALILGEGKTVIKRIFGADANICTATLFYVEENKP